MIGVTTAPTILSPWIPKNQNNWEISNRINIDGKDSVALNKGCNRFVKRFASPSPVKLVHNVFNKIKPTTFIAIGIKILNGEATFGGTDAGILIVIFLDTNTFVISTVNKATMIAVNIPPAPKLLIFINVPFSNAMGAAAIAKKVKMAVKALSSLGN